MLTNIKIRVQRYIQMMTAGGYDQTEAHIFSHFEDRGVPRSAIDEAIDEGLDAGLFRSTLIDARSDGFGYLPALCAA